MPFHFACASCGEPLEADDPLAGELGFCPDCGAHIRLPSESGGLSETMQITVEVADGLVCFGDQSVASLLRERGIDGGVRLGDSLSSSDHVVEGNHRYKVGGVVATGGMGAVLEVPDAPTGPSPAPLR